VIAAIGELLLDVTIALDGELIPDDFSMGAVTLSREGAAGGDGASAGGGCSCQ